MSSLWAIRENSEAFRHACSCDNAVGDTVLHLAVRKDDVELARCLLRTGFPVDLVNDEKQTALYVATRLGLVDVCQLLLDFGADVLASLSSPKSGSGGHSDSESDAGMEPQASSASKRTSSEPRKGETPFSLAFDADNESLLKLFIGHALLEDLEQMQEWDLLQFMAQAYVENRTHVMDAFEENGWTLDRRHARISRPFLHYVAQYATDDRPIKALLAAGANARAADRGGATALHVAAQLGSCDDGTVLKHLIAAGAKVDAKDQVIGGTPLATAAQARRRLNVCVLLDAGADATTVIKMDGKCRTVLHLAAQGGDLEILELLLGAGADPNVLDEMGGTAAQWAVRDNNIAAVRVLLDHGLEPNADKGHSLRIALMLGDLEIAKLFVERGATVDESCIMACNDREHYKGDRKPFYKFCAEHMTRQTEGDATDDNDEDASGAKVRLLQFNIPSMMENRHFVQCAVLLEHGFGKKLTELSDLYKALLLCICTEHNFRAGIARLLATGKVTNTIRRFGVQPYRWTALHIAVWNGNLDLMELFLSQGWSLMQEDSDGRSAVDLAMFEGHYEIARALLRKHLTAEHRDQFGNTPLLYAVTGRRDDVRLLELLVDAGCSIAKANIAGETVLHRAVRSNYSAAVEWLLEKGSAVNALDRYGNHPLHVAACFDADTSVKILLDNGADINHVAADGRTPLHCAAQSGANTAVATLLAAGADTNNTDAQGRTALATAVYWGQSSMSTIETLLSHTTVEWTAPRTGNLIVAAVLARKSTNRARVLERILEALRTEKKRKAPRVVRKLMPELVQEMLVSAHDDDYGSPADVMPLLLEFLPQNDKTRHVLLCRMLITVIEHGGDDDGELARSQLLLDESNATQALPGMWGLQHLACKYDRLKTLRVLVAFGLSPLSRVDINGVPHTPLDIAKEFSPGIVSRVEDLLKGIEALMRFQHSLL